jgi:error-prone DNA polymerase
MASLERLAWAGALDALPVGGSAAARREALWAVGVTANGRGGGRGRAQLALPIEPPAPPPLEPLGEWGELIADYRSTGIAFGKHPMELMRPGLDPELRRGDELARIGDGEQVEVAGMVVARQRPGTAKGIVFMTLEDESGIVNVIVPKRVYERHRAAVRSAVMVRAHGRLERREGVINVLVDAVEPLERGEVRQSQPPPRPPAAEPPGDPHPQRIRERAVAELRAVAPAGHSFGRRGH